MRRIRGKILAFCLVAMFCALAVLLAELRNGDCHTSNEGAAADVREPDHPQMPRTAAPTTRSPALPKPVLDFGADDEDAEYDARTPAEKDLASRIERALDDEDLELALSCAKEAQSCAITEIRQAMVDTLGWFGEKAIPELTPFLADADEDVRDSAMSEWSMALSAIEDDVVKIRTVELAMGALKDEDALEDISGEYIGVDEKLAVESLVRIIDGGGSNEGIEKAKETYEFVTGNEWAGADEAARWIAEDYEPSEAE